MQQPDPTQVQHMMLAMVPFMALMGLVGAAIVIIPFWQIFKKAGMSPFLSLLMFVPLVGIVMLYVLAFSQWRVVPAPDYGAGYPPVGYPPPVPYPPPGYVPQSVAPGYVPPTDPPAAV